LPLVEATEKGGREFGSVRNFDKIALNPRNKKKEKWKKTTGSGGSHKRGGGGGRRLVLREQKKITHDPTSKTSLKWQSEERRGKKNKQKEKG